MAHSAIQTWHMAFGCLASLINTQTNPLCISNTMLLLLLLLGRLYGVTGGLLFYTWCFFFFSPRVLRVPSTDRPENLPPERNLRVFYNASPKIRGALPPKKFGGQKHAKFRSILDHCRLWSRISPERLKISKISRRYKLWQFLVRLTKKVR